MHRRGPGSGMPLRASALEVSKAFLNEGWKRGREADSRCPGAPHFSHSLSMVSRKQCFLGGGGRDMEQTDKPFLKPQPLAMAKPETFWLKHIWPLSRTRRMLTYSRTFLSCSQERKLCTLRECLYPKSAWPMASDLLISAFHFLPPPEDTTLTATRKLGWKSMLFLQVRGVLLGKAISMALFVGRSDKGGQAGTLNSWRGDGGNNKFQRSLGCRVVPVVPFYWLKDFL